MHCWSGEIHNMHPRNEQGIIEECAAFSQEKIIFILKADN